MEMSFWTLITYYNLFNLLQAMENFAWNIRVLKGQADLLRQAQHDCIEYMKQVCTFYIPYYRC